MLPLSTSTAPVGAELQLETSQRPVEMPGWVMAKAAKEKKLAVPRLREHAPLARCFGFLRGQGC